MGKIAVKDNQDKQRHNPLYTDITTSGGNLRSKARGAAKSAKQEDEYLDASTSRKILQLAKEQQDELKEEESRGSSFGDKFRSQQPEDNDDDNQIESESEEEEDVEEYYEDEEEIEVDENDAALFEKYFQQNGNQNNHINLVDKILAKIQEKEDEKLRGDSNNMRHEDAVLLPPKVIAAYEKIGRVLSTYTHGKLPKLFKVLPTLNNWEDVLFVTQPSNWSPHAVYEATKLFVSNLQSNEAQKFVESVLLERFRTSIEDAEDHTLKYHIYRALKKSLYKPAAFFKGFLFPLVDSYCSVREATIAASVLAKVSVPVLHSSVALTQLVQRDFQPSTTVFIRVLIEKKYALPYQTLDELVFYFMRFRNAAQPHLDSMDIEDNSHAREEPKLPVVWHKAFLAFAQRYKNDITDDQRDFLLETCRQRFHNGIGPEIRRELLAGQPRLTSEIKSV